MFCAKIPGHPNNPGPIRPRMGPNKTNADDIIYLICQAVFFLCLMASMYNGTSTRESARGKNKNFLSSELNKIISLGIKDKINRGKII